MIDRTFRLPEMTAQDMARLRTEAEELAQLQAFLDKLPLQLRVDALTEPERERLRQIVAAPKAVLCGSGLLCWHNLCRPRLGLEHIS